MKVAILAGGQGTRMGSLTKQIPKPMVDIGGCPILSHVIKHYVNYGFRDFVVALGHLGSCIREYFEDPDAIEPGCSLQLVDTGSETATGGRIKRLAAALGNEAFMLTWGDGLADVDLDELSAFHRAHGRLATVTAVQPPSRFGHLQLQDDHVVSFEEKPERGGVWINGAFFVLEPEVFDYIADDNTPFERQPMEQLAADHQLMAYRHPGFWQCMDTVSEWQGLKRLWSLGQAPWATSPSSVRENDALATSTPLASSALAAKRRVLPRQERVLVTGHDGYVGHILVPMLLEAGYDVCGLDSLLYKDCVFFTPQFDVPNIQKDIRDVTIDDLRGFEAVIHLAGLSNDPLGDLDAQLTFQINYQATMDLAVAAKAAGVSRFLQASTCSIYGASDDNWLTESSAFNPVTPYGIAKARVEPELQELADDQFSPTLLRFATAYGVSPRLRGDLVVNNLAGYAVTTGEILLKSDGQAWRPLVHIEDISRALLATLQAPRHRVHNEAYNIGSTSENYSIRQIAEQIGVALPDAKIAFANNAEPDRRNYRVNCDKLARVLPEGRPRWNLQRGIQELVVAYQENGLTLQMLESSQVQRLAKIRGLLDAGRLSPNLRWAPNPDSRLFVDRVTLRQRIAA